MRKFLLGMAAVMVFTLFASSVNAQYYCFWVANNSNETFYTLKVRPSGQGSFSQDLLPSDLIDYGKHFWVKTGHANSRNWDVEITDLNGQPLPFAWTGVDGNYYERDYITIDAKLIHTLAILSNSDGSLSFQIYNNDALGYGHPCNN